MDSTNLDNLIAAAMITAIAVAAIINHGLNRRAKMRAERPSWIWTPAPPVPKDSTDRCPCGEPRCGRCGLVVERGNLATAERCPHPEPVMSPNDYDAWDAWADGHPYVSGANMRVCLDTINGGREG